MQILSARIQSARRLREFGEVKAVVALLLRPSENDEPLLVRVLASSPAEAAGAAPLRQRLIASAKLSYYSGRMQPRHSRHAA